MSLVKDILKGYSRAKAAARAFSIVLTDSNGKIANALLNTGTGNALDSDTVDGLHASAFALSGSGVADAPCPITSHVNGGGSLEIWNYAPLPNIAQTLTANAHTTGTLRLMPFIAPARGGTIDRIAFNITTAGGVGNTVRIGIYDSVSATNIYPNALLSESAAISVNGITGIQTHTVNIPLTAGRVYWIAISTSTTLTLRGGTATTCSAFLGFSNTMPTTPNTHLTIAHVHGALPNPLGAGAVFATANHPVGAYRFSA